MAGKGKKGKKREKIMEDLRQRIQFKIDERDVILDQLSLLDIKIDEIDEFIVELDKDIPGLTSEINAKVNALKAAYDARISSGCKSSLYWKPGETVEDTDRGAGYTEYICDDNPDTVQRTNKYGVKYFQKPKNRDFGTNIIMGFVGIASDASDVIAVLTNANDVGLLKTSVYDNEGVLTQRGDTVTDNLEAPSIFSVGELPEIVGIGTTNAVGFHTSIGGLISAGSTIFANTGIGSTTIAQIGYILSLPTFLQEDTRVVGFGTTVVTVNIENPGESDGITGSSSTATEMTVPSFILSKPAIGDTSYAEPQVGILTNYTALFLSTTTQEAAYKKNFTVFRANRGIDTDFDYKKSPHDPLKIDIMNTSTLGFGHSVFLVNNGDPFPEQTVEYDSSKGTSEYKDADGNTVIDNPEPKVGAGFVQYNLGTDLWPVKVEYDDGNARFQTTSYAAKGDVVRTGLGTAATAIETPPPSYPGQSACDALDAAIQTAQDELNAVIATNSPIIRKRLEQSKTLRRVRDDLETEAWGLLQAAAYTKQEYTRLLGDSNELESTDFEDFDPD